MIDFPSLYEKEMCIVESITDKGTNTISGSKLLVKHSQSNFVSLVSLSEYIKWVNVQLFMVKLINNYEDFINQ